MGNNTSLKRSLLKLWPAAVMTGQGTSRWRSHRRDDVLADSILTRPILSTGGVMIWDDRDRRRTNSVVKASRFSLAFFATNSARPGSKIGILSTQMMVSKIGKASA